MLHDRVVDRILIQTNSLERWVIRHILKEANHIADRIIKMVYVDLKGLNVMEITPMELLEAQDSDKASGAFDIVSLA
ncbi:hypothetical protein Goshw_009163 [Gossypium schwendimanii]|uniref:RNase H type-1 domain-containing protein n=1 Tax=Gossypium schwendimanii TaxID=34291 RepID=A0A7J9M271_GOSSC|nr:hypothetical protein [Gossypium schwendimanii]